jgi:hypothetical protein
MESFERQRFELRQSIDGDGLIRVVVVGELDMATAAGLRCAYGSSAKQGWRLCSTCRCLALSTHAV